MNRRPRLGAGRPVGVALVAFIALLTTACGAALQKLPAGPGVAAADALTAFSEAVETCRSVRSLSAELSVSGTAGGQRLRGRVLAGLDSPASALLDAAAPFGASLFIYAAHDGRATLLLPRDQRVLRDGEPASVLEAVTGVPLDAADLRRALTGCAPDGDPTGGRSFGSEWRAVAVAGADAFLRRQADGVWRLVAVVHGGGSGWRADYGEFAGGLPQSIRLLSADQGRRFDLRLRLSQVERNPALGGDVFSLKIPDGVTPITIDELRRSGPMAEAR